MTAPRRRVLRCCVWFAGFLLVIWTGAWVINRGQPIDLDSVIAYELLAGWFLFPWRVAPHLTFNVSSIVTFLVVLIGLGIAMHRAASWWQSNTEGMPWRVRSTLLSLALGLAVLSTCLAGGMVIHQVGWLLTHKRSVVVRALPKDYDAGTIEQFIRSGIGDDNARPIDRDVWDRHLTSGRDAFVIHEAASIVPTYAQTGDVMSWTIVLRDPKRRAGPD